MTISEGGTMETRNWKILLVLVSYFASGLAEIARAEPGESAVPVRPDILVARDVPGRCDLLPYLPMPNDSYCQGVSERDFRYVSCTDQFPQTGDGRRCFELEGQYGLNRFTLSDLMGKGRAEWRCSRPVSGNGTPVCNLVSARSWTEDNDQMRIREEAYAACQDAAQEDKDEACWGRARNTNPRISRGPQGQPVPRIFRR